MRLAIIGVLLFCNALAKGQFESNNVYIKFKKSPITVIRDNRRRTFTLEEYKIILNSCFLAFSLDVDVESTNIDRVVYWEPIDKLKKLRGEVRLDFELLRKIESVLLEELSVSRIFQLNGLAIDKQKVTFVILPVIEFTNKDRRSLRRWSKRQGSDR